ncbi:MAG: ketopantoate reductase family protein [Promethearchaeota archaeon]
MKGELSKKDLRIGFIGAGSIGSLFGGYLADIKSDTYSMEIIFFCPKSHAEEINRHGLKLSVDQQTKVIENIQAYENEKIILEKVENNSSFRFDFIFLTTKAYDSESAIIQYKKIVEASKWLVILQNGIGNEDIVIPYCEKSKIMRIVTTVGAFLSKPGHVTHTGKGITNIGFAFLNNLSANKIIKEQAKLDLIILKDLLILAGFNTEVVEDIIAKSWEKVLVNIGINALGALTRLPNGKLLESKGLKSIMEASINETITVAKRMKIDLAKRNYLEATYDVARKTSENKNSMLQDILNKKPTEIEFINGRILKYAEKLGISVTINALLTYLIRALEKSTM